MQKNSGNFSMENMMQFAKSTQGQQLLAMLQNTNDPAIKSAMEHVSKGNLKAAEQILKGFTPSEAMQKAMKQSGGQ